jgi:hypothetical protein
VTATDDTAWLCHSYLATPSFSKRLLAWRLAHGIRLPQSTACCAVNQQFAATTFSLCAHQSSPHASNEAFTSHPTNTPTRSQHALQAPALCATEISIDHTTAATNLRLYALGATGREPLLGRENILSFQKILHVRYFTVGSRLCNNTAVQHGQGLGLSGRLYILMFA